MNKYEVTYERVIDMTDVEEVIRLHNDGWTLYHEDCNSHLNDTMSKLAYKECIVYAENNAQMIQYVNAFTGMNTHRCDNDGNLLEGMIIAYIIDENDHYVCNRWWEAI